MSTSPTSTPLPYTTLFRSAIQTLVQRLSGDTVVALDVTGPPRSLPPAAEANLLRMAQEAVANAYRHAGAGRIRSEEHTSELQSLRHLVCRLLLEKKNPQKSSRKRIGHPLASSAVISRQTPQKVMDGKIVERLFARGQDDGCIIM